MPSIRYLLITLLFITFAYSQSFYLSGGLTAQFGEGIQPGIEIGDTIRNPYNYQEHYLDLIAGYKNFSIWTSFEFSNPPQIGPDFSGIRKLRLMWESDKYSVSVGDLYGQFGRGLALNLWENQGIDWDSSLRGVWVKVNLLKKFSLDFIRGSITGGHHLLQEPGVDPRIRDFTDDETVNAVLMSTNDILSNLTVGTYAVSVNANNPWFSKIRSLNGYETTDSTTVKTKSLMPGLYLEYFGEFYDIYGEFTHRRHQIVDTDSLYSSSKWKWIHYNSENSGFGGYASFSVYPGRWGVTLEYKNYMFDKSNPDIRSYLPYRLNRICTVQSPPSVFKEHSFTLISRTPHVMDFGDEVGYQIEANLEINPDLFIVLNHSRSSRHSTFRKIINHDREEEWEKKDGSSKLLVNGDEEYYPFTESFIELNYHFDPLSLDFIGLVSNSSEILEYDRTIQYLSYWEDHSKEILRWGKRNIFTIPTQLTINLPSNWGFTLYWEHQWENIQNRDYIIFKNTETGEIDSTVSDGIIESNYYYRYFSATIGKPSKFSVGFVYDYTSNVRTGLDQNTNPDNDSWLEKIIRNAGVNLTNKWFGIEFTGYLTSSTILKVFYGSLQGGIKCDSGVCVYVPGIEDALTLTLTSNF